MHETSERATDESEDGRAASTSNRCPPASSPRNEKCSAAASVEPSTACTADARPSGKTTEEVIFESRYHSVQGCPRLRLPVDPISTDLNPREVRNLDHSRLSLESSRRGC